MSQEKTVPSDKAQLTFLLVSGQKWDYIVAPTDTVEQVLTRFFSEWPQEWASLPKANGPENLKMLLRGKFLERQSTITSNQIPTGQATVVHLLIKNEATAEGDCFNVSTCTTREASWV
ncbi:hypothetical protein EDD86DRAFT_187992 [Gorgonomyces haynaldii]|nr:hypothetical protein EDD86DRAFT_187992 [Gorgonomyces haynaldii]